MTRQRRVILQQLRRLRSHPSAEDVYELVRRRLPRISLATVYRNLEILCRCGMIRKLDLSCPPGRFDGNTADHHHVRCIACGRIDDVHLKMPARLAGALQEACDYQILGYGLELRGLCPACRKKGRGPDGNRAKPRRNKAGARPAQSRLGKT